MDVVLNSLTEQLLHNGLQAYADVGRFVEVGKRDIVDNGNLDMSIFHRGVTFMAFDLTSLYWSQSESKRMTWKKYESHFKQRTSESNQRLDF